MRIAHIEAIWLHVDLDETQHHVSSFGTSAAFDTTLVRVHTECGLTGHGEARASVNSFGANGGLCKVIEEDLAPQLLGMDPRAVKSVWDKMYNGPRADLARARGRTSPALNRRGLNVCGMSGVDMALWDILGQSLGAPVWRLLGGDGTGRRLPAYASGGWGTLDEIGAELTGYLEKSPFHAVKMRVSPRDGSIERSAERVKAARRAIGPEVGLMIDAHGSFSMKEARRLCRLVDDCNLSWFEEPVTADDKAGLAQVRAATDIPIAAGEAEFTRFAFRDLIQAGAVDMVQPDLATTGGITEAVRIEALAAAHHLNFSAHIWAGAPAFAAGLHVSAAASTVAILEYSVGANPMLHQLCTNPPTVRDGYLEVPDLPGLGLQIDESFVSRHRVDREMEPA